MSEGSLRLTIRVGVSMRAAIEEAVARHNEAPSCIEWSITDFCIQAIADKLNHGERSRKSKRKVKIVTDDVGGSTRKRLEWTEADVKHAEPETQLQNFERTLDTENERV